MTDDTESQRRVAIGQVVRPHGIKGEVKIRLYNADSKTLASGVPVHLSHDGRIDERVIAAIREVPGGFVLVKFDGVDSRDEAERLRNREVLVHRGELEPLEDDEFYIADIIGATVAIEGTERVGRVTEYLSYPAAEVLVVVVGGVRYEVPLLDDFVVSVDDSPEQPLVVLRNIDSFVVEH